MRKSTKEYPLKMKITFLLERGEDVTDLGTLTYKAGELEEEYASNVLSTFREDLREVFGEEEEGYEEGFKVGEGGLGGV